MSQNVPRAIVIGASAGALEALSTLLPQLPQHYRLPVIVVVHLPEGRESLLASLLHAKCHMQVKEADDKETIAAHTIYIAPPNYHLLVEQGGYFSLSVDDPVAFSRPSINVLFESAADAYGSGLIGIILTGANDDGAQGLKTITDEGGTALVQSPDTAYCTQMPRAAIAACEHAKVFDLNGIAHYLQQQDTSHG